MVISILQHARRHWSLALAIVLAATLILTVSPYGLTGVASAGIGSAAGQAPDADQPDNDDDDDDSGSTGGIGSAAGQAPDADQPEEDQDDDDAFCDSCGWVGRNFGEIVGGQMMAGEAKTKPGYSEAGEAFGGAVGEAIGRGLCGCNPLPVPESE